MLNNEPWPDLLGSTGIHRNSSSGSTAELGGIWRLNKLAGAPLILEREPHGGSHWVKRLCDTSRLRVSPPTGGAGSGVGMWNRGLALPKELHLSNFCALGTATALAGCSGISTTVVSDRSCQELLTRRPLGGATATWLRADPGTFPHHSLAAHSTAAAPRRYPVAGASSGFFSNTPARIEALPLDWRGQRYRLISFWATSVSGMA